MNIFTGETIKHINNTYSSQTIPRNWRGGKKSQIHSTRLPLPRHQNQRHYRKWKLQGYTTNEYGWKKINKTLVNQILDFPDGRMIKKSACQHRRCKRHGFDPWSRKWQPITVFLPGESHGQRSLVATVHGIAKNWTWLSDWAEQSTWSKSNNI